MRRISSIVWSALNAVVAILFALGYLAYYGYPRGLWWVEMIAVALPFLGIAIVLLLIVNIIARRLGLVLVMGLLTLLAVIRLPAWERYFNTTQPSDDDMTIMTFNVPRWWGYRMATKTIEMASFVDSVRPDIAALQEATLAYIEGDPTILAPSYVKVLIDSLGYDPAGKDFENGRFNTPQPVLGQVEFLGKEQVMFTHPEDNDEGGMNVVRARFRWKGREAVLYNLHLRTYGRDKPWQEYEPAAFDRAFWFRYMNQYRHAYQIRNWEVDQVLNMVESEEVPVILVGDLNSTPNNWVYRRLAEGRQDAFRKAGRGWGATYHTRFPVVRIDFILVGPEWEVVEARVPRVWLSDHLPVVARLRWADSGSLSESAP